MCTWISSGLQAAQSQTADKLNGLDSHSTELPAPSLDSAKDLDAFLTPKLELTTSNLNAQAINGSKGQMALSTLEVKLSNVLGGIAYEEFHFDWDRIDQLPFGDGVHNPIEKMTRVQAFGRLPYPIDDKNMLLVGLGLSSTFEKQTDDSYSYDVFGLISHDLVSNASWQYGAYLQYHPVKTIVLPILEYTFNFNAQHTKDFYGHLGFPKTKIGYYLTPKWKTDFEAIYRQAIAKLDKNSVIDPDGYAQVKSWRGEWALYYLATKQLEIKTAVKYTLTREWYSYDRNYRQTQHHYIDNAIGFGIGLVYSFN